MTIDQNRTQSPSDSTPTSQATPGAPPKFNVLAIVGFIGAFFLSLPGIICSAIALRQIDRTGERGRGLAIGGIVVGALNMVVSFVGVIFIVIGAMTFAKSAPDVSVDLGSTSSSPRDCATIEVAATIPFSALESAASTENTDSDFADKLAIASRSAGHLSETALAVVKAMDEIEELCR